MGENGERRSQQEQIDELSARLKRAEEDIRMLRGDSEETSIETLSAAVARLDHRLAQLAHLARNATKDADSYELWQFEQELDENETASLNKLLADAANSVAHGNPMGIEEFQNRIWEIVPGKKFDRSFAHLSVLLNVKHGRYVELHDHFVGQGMPSAVDVFQLAVSGEPAQTRSSEQG